jgi:hypothetical protein
MAGMFQASNLAMDSGLKDAMAGQKDANAGAQLFTGVPLASAGTSISNSATVIGQALNEGYGGAKADENTKKRRMAAVADALSLVSALPFVPQIKPALLVWGKIQVLNDIRGSAPNDAGKTYADLDRKAQTTLRDNVANLLLQNGYLDDEAIAGAQKRGTDVPPVLPGIVTTSPSGVRTFRTDSDDYINWMGTSPLSLILTNQVVGPYKDQWEVPR